MVDHRSRNDKLDSYRMPWYKRNMREYKDDTADLSLAEHGAYTLLLDLFYIRMGEPLPAKLEALFRMVGAIKPDEQEAVASVVSRYWHEVEGGLINGRALREIDAAKGRAEQNKENRHSTNGATTRQTNGGTVGDALSRERVRGLELRGLEEREENGNAVKVGNPGFPTVKVDQFFDQSFKKVYPKRTGAQPWSRAKRAFLARLKNGDTSEQMLDGAKRYARYCEETDILNTEYVMQAATFLGPERMFVSDWTPPSKPLTKAEKVQVKQDKIMRDLKAKYQDSDAQDSEACQHSNVMEDGTCCACGEKAPFGRSLAPEGDYLASAHDDDDFFAETDAFIERLERDPVGEMQRLADHPTHYAFDLERAERFAALTERNRVLMATGATSYGDAIG